LQQKLIEDVQAVVKKLYDVSVDAELSRPDPQFGDFATNVALQISKKLGRSPREIAEQVAGKLKNETIESANVAGPGFINLKLSDQALVDMLYVEPLKTLEGKEVVAEYSDPNPFKALHAGHLYTSLVGDAVANLLENAGANVHRVNFGGDVGLHVAKAMWAILKELGGENPEKLKEVPEAERPTWMSNAYVKGSTAYDEDETAKAEIIAINKRVYELHEKNDKESPFAVVYWTCRQWSYDGFDALYKRLGMQPFEKYYPESVTTPKGVEAVNKGLEEGVFTRSQGAVIYDGEKEGLHTRVFLTGEGLPTYEAKDLGLALNKWQDYHFDLSVMITGNEIVEYMKVVQAALSHFEDEIVKRTRHLTHGHIKLQGGVKMSSRKGQTLAASDVLDSADEANKQATGKDDQSVVIGAVKYAFLKQRIGGDIVYDPSESVSLEGNSGPYLQYAHARASSILRKAGESGEKPTNIELGERDLVRKLGEFNEVVALATEELMPHHIATYLYELAQEFNRFYENNKVVGDPRQPERQAIVSKYTEVLKKGLGLLGINAPEQM